MSAAATTDGHREASGVHELSRGVSRAMPPNAIAASGTLNATMRVSIVPMANATATQTRKPTAMAMAKRRAAFGAELSLRYTRPLASASKSTPHVTLAALQEGVVRRVQRQRDERGHDCGERSGDQRSAYGGGSSAGVIVHAPDDTLREGGRIHSR